MLDINELGHAVANALTTGIIFFFFMVGLIATVLYFDRR